MAWSLKYSKYIYWVAAHYREISHNSKLNIDDLNKQNDSLILNSDSFSIAKRASCQAMEALPGGKVSARHAKGR